MNKGNIWITNFHLFANQMPTNSSLFNPWPEYRTKCLLFKPSVTQPFSQTTYDLNNKPFDEQTIFDHLNIELVRYSDQYLNNGLEIKRHLNNRHSGETGDININTLDHHVFLKVLENKYLEIYKFEG